MTASIMMTSEELFEKVVEVTPEIEWRNAQRAESINGDFDIIDSARAELRFLKLVDCTPALQDSEVLERAVDRCAASHACHDISVSFFVFMNSQNTFRAVFT